MNIRIFNLDKSKIATSEYITKNYTITSAKKIVFIIFSHNKCLEDVNKVMKKFKFFIYTSDGTSTCLLHDSNKDRKWFINKTFLKDNLESIIKDFEKLDEILTDKIREIVGIKPYDNISEIFTKINFSSIKNKKDIIKDIKLIIGLEKYNVKDQTKRDLRSIRHDLGHIISIIDINDKIKIKELEKSFIKIDIKEDILNRGVKLFNDIYLASEDSIEEKANKLYDFLEGIKNDKTK